MVEYVELGAIESSNRYKSVRNELPVQFTPDIEGS